MARIRTVKPEFWTDRRVGECSPTARLLFIATWNFADDEGGLDRSAKQLKAQAFPYDNIDCEPLIKELLSAGLLVEYESGGDKYLHIKNFHKHQRIDKPQKARIPVYEENNNTPRKILEHSRSARRSKGMEGNGKEGNHTEGVAGTRESEAIPVHDSLPLATWEEWMGHRRKRHWPMDSTTLTKQLNVLKPFDTETQRTMIDQAINAGWQGIFPPKGAAKKPFKPPPSTLEIEEREAKALGITIEQLRIQQGVAR